MYLVFALSVTGDPGVNLLATVLVGSGLLLLKGIIRQLYKSLTVDIIEIISYFSIVLLSGAGLFMLKFGNGQTLTDCISIVILLVLLLFVITYYDIVFTKVCKRLWKKLKERRRAINVDRINEVCNVTCQHI